ncbi:MAG TPA: BON domain-containing protein [Chloroflexota bacterium]|nr:BON domain-containing protein [Chloroflexota bacterium]
MRSDTQIHRDVLRELRADPRVEAVAVGVAVENGVVTLTGTVASYVERLAAQEAAHRVRGVLDVANDIEVRAPGVGAPTDAEIAHAVRQALEWDVLVPAERIRSTVAHGVVTLDGTVELGHERQDAEHIVRRLRGVREVLNRLVVSAAPVDADDVRQQIEDALERRADRTAKHIQVTVGDGVVTLAGPVHSWAEREAVVGAARYLRGVRDVEDRLTVDWYS